MGDWMNGGGFVEAKDNGRFIASTGAQIVEIGPVNESIHKLNERVCRLAAGLSSLGATVGSAVGFYMPMTEDVVVALLAFGLLTLTLALSIWPRLRRSNGA